MTRQDKIDQTKMPHKLDVRYPRIFVEWRDTQADAGWQDLDRLDHPAVCFTCGWLIEEDDEHILIAGSIGRRTADAKIQVSDTNSIPRGCVTKITKQGKGDRMRGHARPV